MRYLEIVVNIAILGGKCFDFVGDLLNKGLALYKTEDILLKMAMVQVISGLGDAHLTSKLLREHTIWKEVEKDACVLMWLCRMLVSSFMCGSFC